MKFLFLCCSLILFRGMVHAQNCFPPQEDSTINLTCNSNCTNISFRIPDLRSSSSYSVSEIEYAPYPWTDPRGTAITFTGGPIWPGNSYSELQSLPFAFCFFDSIYNELAIGANGTVTFDRTMARQWCDPFIRSPSTTVSLPSDRYARQLIAGVMHDLDPGDTLRASPTKKVELRIEGDAPCRKALITFFEVPLWPGRPPGCQQAINTHQIVLHESTGFIDVFVKDCPPCLASNGGFATIGLQNYARDIAFAPRRRNGANWGGYDINEAYRFRPSGPNSLLVSADLYLNGRLVASATTAPGNPGELIATFANICPPATNNMYVLRAVYASCNGSTTIEFNDTVYVNKTNSMDANATAEPAICASNSGSITVEIQAGVGIPPINYSLNFGTPQAGNIFSGLTAGTYTVVVSDATICADTITVVVPRVDDLSVSLDVSTTSCNGASDGSITVNATRGQPPYQYSINGNPFQTGNVFSNLAAGNYLITVTDAAGCRRSNVLASVMPGPALTTTFTKRDVSCFGGGDGSIFVNPPSGGVLPHSYSIDGINFQTSNIFRNLPAGNYTIRIRDNGSCSGQINIVINQPAVLMGNLRTVDARCNGEANAQIIATATGGVPPYNYSLDNLNWQPSGTFSVVAGNYTVYIADVNGCRFTTTTSVGQPSVFTIAAIRTDATCDNDGTITLTAQGGVTTYEYSFETPLAFQTSNTFTAPPGNYRMIARDANGCQAYTNATIALQNDLNLRADGDATICEGTSTRINAVSNADNYLWSPAASLDNPASASASASPVIPTEYVVTATLGRCIATDTVFVNVNRAPVPDAGPNGEICVGQNYRLQGSGGFTYSWSPITYLDNASAANPLASPNQSILYTLRVVDENGCSSLVTDDVRVTVIPPFNVNASPVDTTVSTGDQVQLRALSPGINYVWSPATGLNDPFVSDPIATINGSITYTVVATTDAGCRGEGKVTIKAYKGPELYIPTAFTPNNDGKNDVFKPFPVGMKKLNYFRVYNRWGALIFSTKELNKGWDGKFGGQDQASDVYVWMAEGVTKDDQVITRKGTVVLVR